MNYNTSKFINDLNENIKKKKEKYFCETESPGKEKKAAEQKQTGKTATKTFGFLQNPKIMFLTQMQ